MLYYNKMSFSQKKIGIFEFVLFILVLLQEIQKVYIISNSDLYATIENFVQVGLYLILICIIITKKYTSKQLTLFTMIGILLFVGYIKSGQAAYFRAFMLMLASKETAFEKILRTCRLSITCGFLLTVTLWLFGISDSGVGRRGKLAFGYVHPNIAAQVVMIIMLLWITEKGKNITTKDYIVFEAIALLTLILTGSKTSVIIIAIAPLLIEISKKCFNKKKINKAIKLLCEGSQLAVVFFTWWSAKMLPYSSFLKSLDLVFTNRIFLNYYQLNKFAVKPFGQNVSLHEASGAYNAIQNFWAAITCDCTYTLSFIIMGIVPTLLFMLGYIFLMKKAIESQNYIVITSALLLAIYAFCEAQLVEIYNNFVYFYIFSRSSNIYRVENYYDT